MGEDPFQIFSFAVATVVSLNGHSNVIQYLALLLVFIFLTRRCLTPVLPGTRIRALQKKLEETDAILRLALSESLRDRVPHFILQVELDLLCAKLFASRLHSDTLRAKQITWKNYLPFLRGISLKAARCQMQVKELQIAIMLAVEADRQRRYNELIRDKQIVLSSLISLGHLTDPGAAVIQTHEPFSNRPTYSLGE
ncbi:hypothetical protein B0H11DRAFT_201005 [Mycena galericulata]|nr:hypothetical protein B0H11DRAFT_201005 [Mycena galericulata]